MKEEKCKEQNFLFSEEIIGAKVTNMIAVWGSSLRGKFGLKIIIFL
jgi:hypothetical protein